MEEDWFYLSFVDPSRPKGDKFIGGCYVQAVGEIFAVSEAWRLGINPGGEVGILLVPPEHVPPPEFRERLLTREEVRNL